MQQRRATRVVVTAAVSDNRLATGFAAAALAAAVLINAPMAKADLVSSSATWGCSGSSQPTGSGSQAPGGGGRLPAPGQPRPLHH